ncbi:type II toxin-antitoxin system RelE/ParE family toxin [Rubneribacter badeniensis]|uniref:type II toxin-antitoxin system RelE/ParE family toxin n=1 Tax=Rubneribacter badeniensis TaxID=2070688 RepID=UPI003A8CDE7B
MRSVEFRPRAAVDIEGIVVYLAYALKMPQAARRTAEELYAAIDRIADNPFSGRVLSDDELGREYRRILVKRYWVYYSFTDETLTVWRVFHTTQNHDVYGFELLGE